MIKNKIDDLLKQAMKSQSKEILTGLRSVKSKILVEKTKPKPENLTEEELFEKSAIKEVKEREESNKLYTDKSHPVVLENNKIIESLNAFLPKKLSFNDQKELISNIANQLNAKTINELGKVMSELKKYNNKLDMKTAIEQVKQILK